MGFVFVTAGLEMKNNNPSRIFLILFVIISTLAVHVGAQDRGLVETVQRVSGDTFTVATTTPKGARVFGVKRPSAAVLNAIDSGLTELFAVARKNRYRNRLNYSDYTVFIARADRTKNGAGEYSPDIAVGAAQYAGSVYDQGGFVYAAGMVISNDPAAFLIADHTKDLGRLSNVVRYEGEHLVLYHNDRRRYAETMDHSRGGSHPILQ
jgi:hypothetical protein